MSILRMYYSAADAQRPTHYREAWWEEDVGEFVLHHGKVGQTGTTKVENVSDAEQADALLATFAEQNAADDYVDAHDVVQENFTIKKIGRASCRKEWKIVYEKNDESKIKEKSHSRNK